MLATTMQPADLELMLETLLRRVLRDELPAALAQLLPSPLTEAEREAIAALHDVFGPRAVRTAEIADACATDGAFREPLRQAMRAISPAGLDRQRLGAALGAIAGKTPALPPRLTTPKAEGGSRVWCAEVGRGPKGA